MWTSHPWAHSHLRTRWFQHHYEILSANVMLFYFSTFTRVYAFRFVCIHTLVYVWMRVVLYVIWTRIERQPLFVDKITFSAKHSLIHHTFIYIIRFVENINSIHKLWVNKLPIQIYIIIWKFRIFVCLLSCIF